MKKGERQGCEERREGRSSGKGEREGIQGKEREGRMQRKQSGSTRKERKNQ